MGTCQYKLSIIIPVYNNEHEIRETVIPLLHPEQKNYEIIFINDGSSDHSQVVLEKIKEDYPTIPIKIWTQTNQGVSVARNKGLELAQGEYIFFCDADDKLSNLLLDKIFDKIRSDFDFIFWKHNILRSTGMQQLNYYNLECNSMGEVLEKDLVLKCFMQDKFRLCMGTFVIKRQLLMNNNILYTTECHYGEDLEFIIKVILHSEKFCCIPEELFTYVRRESSAMGKYTLRRFDAAEMVIRLQSYIKNRRINVTKETFEYIEKTYFAKHFIYSFESCIQYLKIQNYCSFWKQLKEKYPNLVLEGKRVLKKIIPKDIGYVDKRVKFMKCNIYLYSFCIMLKNSLSRK